MLELVSGNPEKSEAQQILEQTLKRHLPSQGIWNIGYPGGNANHELYSRGAHTLWYAPDRPSRNSPIPRYWNSFGIYRPQARTQAITVEANIPQRINSGRVAAFFAREPRTGDVYLLHSGRVGGGGKGIGKRAFLAWANPSLVDVSVDRENYRTAILLGRVNDTGLPDRLWQFVRQVSEFKSLAKAGKLNTHQFKARLAVYKRYSKGFSGRKAGLRPARFDYVTYHDDVVDRIALERQAHLGPDEHPIKSNLIDFGVTDGTRLTEVYEVKTAIDRQSLYAGLGQLVSYSALETGKTRLILVLPRFRNLPDEVEAAIRKLEIEIRTFRLVGPDSHRKVTLDSP